MSQNSEYVQTVLALHEIMSSHFHPLGQSEKEEDTHSHNIKREMKHFQWQHLANIWVCQLPVDVHHFPH